LKIPPLPCAALLVFVIQKSSKMPKPSVQRKNSKKNQTFTSSPFFAFAFAICFADLSLALAKSFSILSASFFASAWP